MNEVSESKFCSAALEYAKNRVTPHRHLPLMSTLRTLFLNPCPPDSLGYTPLLLGQVSGVYAGEAEP